MSLHDLLKPFSYYVLFISLSGEQPGAVCGGGPQTASEVFQQPLLQHLPEQCPSG